MTDKDKRKISHSARNDIFGVVFLIFPAFKNNVKKFIYSDAKNNLGGCGG